MDILTITKSQAKKFLVVYHGLDRYNTIGKERAITEYFQKVGSVQFDPLDICGKNAELVLQSRIKDFKPADLHNLLYKKRSLTEGWDKMMCIYNMNDYPFFKRRRDRDKQYLESDKCSDIRKITGQILGDIKKRGPLSSIDLDYQKKIDWSWAPARLSRAALEMLYFSGILGIESRIHSRRKYDLVENLIPEKILFSNDPNTSDNEHWDWHVKRRVSKKISFLAPLDNFMWDRKLIELLFDFQYRWEVYKPVIERQYGYYVLPVLYGDRIIARFEPVRDKKNSKLIIKNWWWEKGVFPDKKMLNAIEKAIIDFAEFLGVEEDSYAGIIDYSGVI
ncbi:MAG: winged helix DNA-binding domain-containing protein [Spirochaetaceae bacterium]|jgi:uncharacterized protein YcaQ|nr:winged helix DNA-binding domain-containing protein [Spirochaetaceae bacterium]